MAKCNACPTGCKTCTRTPSQFGDAPDLVRAPKCSACTDGYTLANQECKANETKSSGVTGNNLVIAVTVPFGAVMIILAVIAYCMQSRNDYQVPQSSAATMGAGGHSTMLQMSTATNPGMGGYNGAVIA